MVLAQGLSPSLRELSAELQSQQAPPTLETTYLAHSYAWRLRASVPHHVGLSTGLLTTWLLPQSKGMDHDERKPKCLLKFKSRGDSPSLQLYEYAIGHTDQPWYNVLGLHRRQRS